MSTFLKTFESGEEITPFNATGVIEGFVDVENESDILRAWGYLIGTGLCWSLQGTYGRQAESLIDNNVINKNGEILFNL